MFKLSLFLSGLLSFWYFLHPASFGGLPAQGEKVLGVKSFNQAVNRETVYTAILAYCLDQNRLPKDLNQLYERELSKERQVDLNELFLMVPKDSSDCEFQLTPK